MEQSVLAMYVLLWFVDTSTRMGALLHPCSRNVLARLAHRDSSCLQTVVRLLRLRGLLLRLELLSGVAGCAFATVEPLASRVLPTQTKGQAEGNGGCTHQGSEQFINQCRCDLQLLQSNQGGKADDGITSNLGKKIGGANLRTDLRAADNIRHYGRR